MDEADITDERIAIASENAINKVRNAVARIPVGIPGECDKCGEDMPRLVDGWCCWCRDKFKVNV